MNMNLSSATIERLYRRYRDHIDSLHQDVFKANRLLGSPTPQKTNLTHLTQGEFETLVRDSENDQEAKRLWIRRIIRDHEGEFPELQISGPQLRHGTGT